MDPIAATVPPGSGLFEPTFNLGLVLPDLFRENEGGPDPWAGLTSALSELASALRQAHEATQRERDGLLVGPLRLRCIALEPGLCARRLDALARSHGWSFLSLEIENGQNQADAAGDFERFVVESWVEHGKEDRLALQTVFLDQSDLVLDLDEPGRSLATAALLRLARLAGIPVLAGNLGVEGGALPDADASLVRSAFSQTLSLGRDGHTSDQIREARSFLRLTRETRQEKHPSPAGEDVIQDVQARLATTLARADEVAGLYGARSRAVAVLRILLGAVATLGVFFAFYFADVVRTFWAGGESATQPKDFHFVESAGYAVDVLAILTVLGLAALSKRRAWYARFAAARYVAEHLRHMPATAALGTTVLRLRARAPGAASALDWPTFYLRAVTRSFGCPPVRVTADYRTGLRRSFDALVADQVRFYQVRAERFSRLAHRLSWLANACFALGLAAVLLRLAVFVWFSGEDTVRVLASLGTFVFPALASIFVALAAQGEYAKLAQRYSAMAETLQNALKVGTPQSSFADLLDHVRGTVTAMLDEVAEWRTLIKSHSVSQL